MKLADLNCAEAGIRLILRRRAEIGAHEVQQHVIAEALRIGKHLLHRRHTVCAQCRKCAADDAHCRNRFLERVENAERERPVSIRRRAQRLTVFVPGFLLDMQRQLPDCRADADHRRIFELSDFCL